jgi:hypothetical protein
LFATPHFSTFTVSPQHEERVHLVI